MVLHHGRDLLAQVEISPGVWVNIPGQRSTSFNLARPQVDVSSKDSRWRNGEAPASGILPPPAQIFVTDGEFHGWSVFRRINADYTGPLFRLREINPSAGASWAVGGAYHDIGFDPSTGYVDIAAIEVARLDAIAAGGNGALTLVGVFDQGLVNPKNNFCFDESNFGAYGNMVGYGMPMVAPDGSFLSSPIAGFPCGALADGTIGFSAVGPNWPSSWWGPFSTYNINLGSDWRGSNSQRLNYDVGSNIDRVVETSMTCMAQSDNNGTTAGTLAIDGSFVYGSKSTTSVSYSEQTTFGPDFATVNAGEVESHTQYRRVQGPNQLLDYYVSASDSVRGSISNIVQTFPQNGRFDGGMWGIGGSSSASFNRTRVFYETWCMVDDTGPYGMNPDSSRITEIHEEQHQALLGLPS